jgi:hypothetical protein
MERLTSIDQLVFGASFMLPTGHRVIAERAPGGAVWALSSAQERRVYGIDAAGRLRLVFYEDVHGDRCRVTGDDGQGGPTPFTVQDLWPVADG